MTLNFQETSDEEINQKLHWNFADINDWKSEFEELKNINVHGSINRNNLIRFAIFFVKTLDYITEPRRPKGH